jgi:hypothetical protein
MNGDGFISPNEVHWEKYSPTVKKYWFRMMCRRWHQEGHEDCDFIAQKMGLAYDPVTGRPIELHYTDEDLKGMYDKLKRTAERMRSNPLLPGPMGAMLDDVFNIHRGA